MAAREEDKRSMGLDERDCISCNGKWPVDGVHDRRLGDGKVGLSVKGNGGDVL